MHCFRSHSNSNMLIHLARDRLATDLQPLPDSWKGAQEDRGHQPAECPDECSQFRRRETNTLSTCLTCFSFPR